MLLKISVLMTVYNAEKFLRYSIESILTQTYNNFKFLIIDDGSTDSSYLIINSYSDQRIISVFIEHKGRATALNVGLSHCTSEYIAFMDADDIASPTRLEEEIKILECESNVGVVGSLYEMIDESGKRIFKRVLPEWHHQIEEQMVKYNSLCFGSSLVRKKLIDMVGGFDKKLTSAIDYDLLLRLLPTTHFYNIQKVLLFCRKHPQRISKYTKDLQNQNTLQLAKRYIQKKYLSANNKHDKSLLAFYQGLIEYYHGSLAVSKSYFLKSLRLGYRSFDVYRYFIAAFNFPFVIKLYRRFVNRQIL